MDGVGSACGYVRPIRAGILEPVERAFGLDRDVGEGIVDRQNQRKKNGRFPEADYAQKGERGPVVDPRSPAILWEFLGI